MATKLSADHINRLKALSVKAKNEEEAKEIILKLLKENGIDDMEGEELETLLSIQESILDENKESESADEDGGEETEKDDDEEDDDEEVGESDKDSDEENDELAKEVEEEDKKKEEKQKKEPKKKATEKPVAEKKQRRPSKKGYRLNPKAEAEDRTAFEPLKELFPEDEYLYAWVANAGVTIKNRGKNSNRSLVLIENCYRKEDGTVTCNLFLLTFLKKLDLLKEAGIEYEQCWNDTPFIRNVSLEEAMDIIRQFQSEIVDYVKRTDKKLGENRKKMEEGLKKGEKPKTKPAAKDDDEEDDEEMPVKKTSKASEMLKNRLKKK